MAIASSNIFPSEFFREITQSASELDPRPRSILIAGTGTISIENSDGSTVIALPVSPGTINNQFFKITAIVDCQVFGYFDE